LHIFETGVLNNAILGMKFVIKVWFLFFFPAFCETVSEVGRGFEGGIQL